MKTRRSRRTTLGISLTTALGVIVTTGVSIGWGGGFTVSAAPNVATDFEIDGDLAVGPAPGQDWESDPSTNLNLRGAPFVTDDSCNAGAEDQIIPGTKLDDIDFDNIAAHINTGNVNNKSDLCAVYQAWEIVEDAGTYEFVFYGGWRRPNVNGEIDVYFPLLGDDPGKADDLLIRYDFQDSTDTTSVDVLEWNGSSWVATTTAAGHYDAKTTRGVVNDPADGVQTFGEFAINLTLSGILPADGPCESFTSGKPMSRTGNSPTANPEDVVDAQPITLTNCGGLRIVKQTMPADPVPAADFDVRTTQADSGKILTSGETQLDANLVVPDQDPDPLADTTSVVYADILISPDYVVEEIGPLGAWTQQSLACVTVDPQTGQEIDVVLFGSGANASSFPVAPAVEAVCTVVNLGPPTVSVSKTTIGDIGGPFDFVVRDSTGDQNLSVSTTAAGVPALAGTVTVSPGTIVVEELASAPGFYAGDLVCTRTAIDGSTSQLVGSAIAGSAVPVSADVAAGESLDCLQENLAPGSATVEKIVDPADATGWTFEFVISPDPATGTPGTGSDTQIATSDDPVVSWAGLAPGVEYSITETDDDGFITGAMTCAGGTGITNGTGTSTFTATSGTAITCTAENTELADVSVTKTVEGTTTPWAFDFTISPDPATGTGSDTQTATDTADTVSWDGLDPAVDYTITETPVDGYITGTLTCDGGGATFTPEAGASVDCAVTNVELANVSVTKTVVGTAASWAFDFTISPVPDGETATKTATDTAPAVAWGDLTPGVAYTIVEAPAAGFQQGTMDCDGDATFTPTPGESVECTIVNSRVASNPPPPVDIQVIKTSGAATVLPGGPLPWTIEVTNNGPGTAVDVVLTDDLPTELTLVSVDAPAAWDCSASTTGNPGTVSCSKANMVAGETWSFTLNTTVTGVTGGETITNVAVVTTITTETTTANNTDSAMSKVEIVAVLPPTGGYVQTRLIIASLLLAVGVALLLLQHRRRELV